MTIPTDVQPAAGRRCVRRATRHRPPAPPALRPVELARWAWRQLTSMRTALVLLFLLALAAVPGSRRTAGGHRRRSRSRTGRSAHPTLTPVYETLGLFSVYDSVWFSAIYLLLMVSLVGCIVPAAAGLLARRAGAPAGSPAQPRPAAGVAPLRDRRAARRGAGAGRERVLRGRRYRDRVGHRARTARWRRERGYLREAGNLLFHVSRARRAGRLRLGQLFGYKGGVITVVGQGFSNSLSQYDDFAPGSLFDPDDLAPLSLTVDDFEVKFLTSGPQRGSARRLLAPTSPTPRSPGADPEQLRPRGEPPADARRGQRVPGRPRLRPGRHRARRQRRRRLPGAGRVPAAGRDRSRRSAC